MAPRRTSGAASDDAAPVPCGRNSLKCPVPEAYLAQALQLLPGRDGRPMRTGAACVFQIEQRQEEVGGQVEHARLGGRHQGASLCPEIDLARGAQVVASSGCSCTRLRRTAAADGSGTAFDAISSPGHPMVSTPAIGICFYLFSWTRAVGNASDAARTQAAPNPSFPPEAAVYPIFSASSAARSPDSSAPFIHPGEVEVWSPAKCTRPSGAARCGRKRRICPGRNQA